MDITFNDLLKYSKRTIKEMRDEFGNIKPEYQELINKIDNAPEYKDIISKLENANSDEEINKIRNEFELKKLSGLSEKEKISKQYGISLDSIEHIKLQDGKEYYHFYDINNNKDIVISQDDPNKNMSEEFKTVQEEVSSLQTNDSLSNGEEAFKYQRLYTNNEVKLYSVDEIMNNPNLLGGIDVEQMKVVKMLLVNKDALKIKEINPETGMAIDENHKVISGYYNENTYNYEISNPNEYSYNNDKVSSDTYTGESNDNVETEEVEVVNDMPSEINGIPIDSERVRLYYEYPEVLDQETELSEAERVAYIEAVEKYRQLEEEQKYQKDKPKVNVLKKNEGETKQAGYINLLLLSLTTGFAGGIITTIMLGIIK